MSGNSLDKKLILLARKSHFNAAVRYYRLEWTDSKNQMVFGKASQDFGHGYSYILEVRLIGEKDPITGLVVNLSEVEQSLSEVISILDQTHLFYQLEAFNKKIPTLENIGRYCYLQLKNRLTSFLVGIRLRQGEDDWVDIIECE